MIISRINRNTKSLQKGRISKKITDFKKFVFQEIKRTDGFNNGKGDINLLSSEHLIQDGIIYCNSNSEIIVYKFGAKKVTQNAMITSPVNEPGLKNINLKKYTFWVPDLYFITSRNYKDMVVMTSGIQRFPMSNIYSREGILDAFPYCPSEVKAFISGKGLSCYRCCVGNSLVSFKNLSYFSELKKNISGMVNTLMSAKGNADLEFRNAWARKAFEFSPGETNIERFHWVYSLYTSLTKNIESEKEYLNFSNQIEERMIDLAEKVKTKKVKIS